MRKTSCFLFLLLTAALLCGCGKPAAGETVTVTGFDGGAYALPARPERVVVLQGSLADLWVTAGGEFVGVTDDAADHGLDMAGAAVVGTTKSPSTEAVLALKPELVIYSPDIAGQSAAAAVLSAAGVPVLPAKVDSFSDYLFHLKLFAGLTGDETAYETYGTAVEERIDTLCAAVPEGEAPPRVLFLRAYSSGVKAKAREHTVCDILEALGAENIAAGESALLEELSMEVILREDPDHIFIVTMGSEEEAFARLEETLFSQPAWQSLSAVEQGHVHPLPRELFHYKPNARWAEAYEYVYNILYS